MFIVNVNINNSLNLPLKSKNLLTLYSDCIKIVNQLLIMLRITTFITSP
ncbi:hypothetical protein HMPREF3212_04649 [Citrobacter freundii]|nr:hypothetical protein HMPREF3212_04649 [Citrobacter freundii]